MTLRLELERFVVAWNTPLKESVQQMDLITLLRNVHPTYRPDFASKLKDAKMITADQAGEFVKFVR